MPDPTPAYIREMIALAEHILSGGLGDALPLHRAVPVLGRALLAQMERDETAKRLFTTCETGLGFTKEWWAEVRAFLAALPSAAGAAGTDNE